MKLKIPSIKELKGHLRDPLYRNSIFLMMSSLTNAGSGFFFWIIAARFYSTEDVGLASAIISAMGLISIFSVLGFDIALVRFLPEREDKSELINTCLTISFIISLILTLIFVAGINIWSPSLSVIRENKFFLFFFVFFSATTSLPGLLSQGVFAGFRRTEYSLFQTLVTLARLGIIPFLVTFGELGIYAPYGLTPILAFGFGIFLASRIFPYKPIPTVNIEIIKDIFHFSFGNYFAKIFEYLPVFVLPIMVINVLGAEMNAYFFMSWQISMLLLTIPRWTTISLLAEGSHNEETLSANTKRALKFIFLLLGPAIIGIFLFGRNILGFFGEEYATNSYELLLVLALGSIPFAINVIYVTTKRVQKEVMPVIYVYGGVAIITLVASYLLMQSMGIIGVGYSWIIGNVAIASGVGMGWVMSNMDNGQG
ncbi:MAG: oligosaccharide flippase family protein [Halobacteriota archaeon]|nr:oligosaccharide flippase family protein [Halobacteriota archaeon]